MRQKIFILLLLVASIIIISGCSKNNPNINQEGVFILETFSESEMEYFNSQEEYFNVKSLPNGVSFEAKFRTDICEEEYTYNKEGNHLKITQNLKLETCADIFAYSGIKGRIENLPKGDYKLSIYYKYDKSLYGENTEPKEVLSKDIKIK